MVARFFYVSSPKFFIKGFCGVETIYEHLTDQELCQRVQRQIGSAFLRHFIFLRQVFACRLRKESI